MDKSLDEAVPSASSEGSKIIASGLPPDVTAVQVREMFSTIIGQVKECSIICDDAGQSTGSASVVFTGSDIALLAYKELNDRSIDGVRTLRIQVIDGASGAREDPSPAKLGVLEARLMESGVSTGDGGQ
ncbi:hypothetical protein FRC01_000669 [Tulasnella sp. 417]|nr:hypothetical protein FRC01_000669 [Tulasnella sp. 417]